MKIFSIRNLFLKFSGKDVKTIVQFLISLDYQQEDIRNGAAFRRFAAWACPGRSASGTRWSGPAAQKGDAAKGAAALLVQAASPTASAEQGDYTLDALETLPESEGGAPPSDDEPPLLFTTSKRVLSSTAKSTTTHKYHMSSSSRQAPTRNAPVRPATPRS